MGSQRAFSLQCNKCWNEIQNGEGYSTMCNHVFCGECAQACYAENTCLACSEPLPAESFHPLSSGKHLKATARMLGLYNPDTIMAAASSALSLLAYQEQLMAAKQRTADKAQLKKIVKQSQVKMGELQGAAKKATLKCKEAMHERAKIESESQKLDEYIEQKSILAKRLKEAIKKEQQKANGFGDIHSKAASDGGWETLHQEVRISGQQGFQIAGRTSGWLQQGSSTDQQQQHPPSQLAGVLPPCAPQMPGRPGNLANVLRNSQMQMTDLAGAKRPIPTSGRRSAASSQSQLLEEGDRKRHASWMTPMDGHINGACAVWKP